ncbi:hypothetical protein [Bartonella schoenbuchensis]
MGALWVSVRGRDIEGEDGGSGGVCVGEGGYGAWGWRRYGRCVGGGDVW